MAARVVVKEEIRARRNPLEEEVFQLCFQWVEYLYDDGNVEEGYRFIWRYPNGNLQPARGQARLPSIAVARMLMERAEAEGWGGFCSSSDVLELVE